MMAIPFTEHLVQRRYEAYLDTFNSRNLGKLKEYLSDDLYFFRGPDVKPFFGREEMLNFYESEVWPHLNETVTLKRFQLLNMSHDAAVNSELCYFQAEIEIHLEVYKDWLDFPYGHPYYAGDDVTVTNILLYAMNADGMITLIQ